MHPPTSRRGRSAALVLGLLLAPTLVSAFPLQVKIGNLPSSQSGDYINATDIANTLAFTSVTIQGDDAVIVEQASDLSISPFFGTTVFDIFLQAPGRIDVQADLKMGAGNVYLTAPTVRLAGILRDADGTALASTRLATTAGQIEVDSGGSVEQASWLAYLSSANPVRITVNGAIDPGLINVWADTRLDLEAGFLENVTLMSASSLFEWTGGQLGETGLFGFGGTVNIHGSSFQIGPPVVCSGIPPSGWSAAPATISNASGCLRGVLSTGEPFATPFNFGGSIHLVPAIDPTPVPTAGWLVAPALALLGWIKQHERA